MKSVQIQSFFQSIFYCIQFKYRKIQTRKNSVFGHFSRCVNCLNITSNLELFNGFPYVRSRAVQQDPSFYQVNVFPRDQTCSKVFSFFIDRYLFILTVSPSATYLFKVNNRNNAIEIRCEICSKLRILTEKKHPEIKLQRLSKNTNMYIWVVGTSN